MPESKSPNHLLISEFEKLKKQITFEMDYADNRKERIAHEFRWQAIERVIELIKKFPKKITSVKQLENVKGIGKGSLERVKEILKTGKLSEIKPFMVDYQKYVEILQTIHGIGRRRAFELVTEYGVKSIDDLKKLYESGAIDLPDSIIRTLKYYDISQGAIPRDEITDIYDYLCYVLLSINPQLFGTICGSYRREASYSNDIDFLMIYPDYKNIRQLKLGNMTKNYLEILVDILIEEKFIVHSLTDVDVDTLYMGFCRWGKKDLVRRIDIRFIPYDSYYTALLYFTGSRNFNITMRSLAKKLGYHLSEYELTDPDGIKIPIHSEKEVFDILGMKYLAPALRSYK
ncbi:MAG: DNA polymerase family X protein [Hyperionvirus sp.]|uniref:DNA-directed DNA polymerase n=1 Tax=Hyperionvirus sp. TaxID=2487770 RepID=A0A3G5A8S3_9VIRU|nr:MAG: DNA polymerase family X protein [Hyperionvirus sp.]